MHADCLKSVCARPSLSVSHLGLDFLSEVRNPQLEERAGVREQPVLLFIYSFPPSIHHCTKQNNSDTWSGSTKVIKGKESFAPEAKSEQDSLIMNDSEKYDSQFILLSSTQ